MTFEVAEVRALEILDSRGRPTLRVAVRLADGSSGAAGVPSGASTGSREAVELRDGDPARYAGAGVTRAVAAVDGEIADVLTGRAWPSPAAADLALIDADGTPGKARLGANAVVGTSMALARAVAAARGVPLWRHLNPDGVRPSLPMPHFNVLNGGAHAPNPLDFQEFMVAPLGAPSLPEAVRAGAEVYAALRRILTAEGHATGLGDEGGFAPALVEPEEALRLLVRAIDDAGYARGRSGVSIALDPAASEFRGEDGVYRVAGAMLTSDDLVERYAALVAEFPIHSTEDGVAEDDDHGWTALTERLGDRVQLVGDDVFVTDPALIEDAAARGTANAALIKLNQIGTVTETLTALDVCRRTGFGAMISHRSGETTDAFIADLAVGSGCGQLKAGAPARGERVAKYNRLLELAAAHPDLPFAP
ncbi:phosphopyruvate hydratase [Actinomadura atramentaria]|uniref:phosphopyruvate hydratase n=1 Tax=Actinomadura atramentaria TaxID=1990 RepID=UPI0003701C69|nr:phosphopyruvate hydratase [Actinomadura atramentaria]